MHRRRKQSAKDLQKESLNAARKLRFTLQISRIIMLFCISVFIYITSNALYPSNVYTSETIHAKGHKVKVTVEEVFDVPLEARQATRFSSSKPDLQIPENLERYFTDTNKPISATDIPLFWHILKSGGTSMKHGIAFCLGKVEASESGIVDGHEHDTRIEKVKVGEGNYINVDTTTPQGIDRAISMGLLRDGNALPEIIFSPYLHESSNLFKDTSYQGRIFCVFRHPIERAVSLFYYLKKASWEPTFSAKLEKIESIEDYAISEFAENNWMVRFLTNELTGIVTEEHLDIAKEIVRRKVLVGLTLDMENSFRRFMHYLGWNIDSLSVDQQQCLNKYIGHGTNQNQHTNEHFGSMGWKILRANNILDLKLYEYALQLYAEQGATMFGIN